jgi:hypothetical protein
MTPRTVSSSPVRSCPSASSSSGTAGCAAGVVRLSAVAAFAEREPLLSNNVAVARVPTTMTPQAITVAKRVPDCAWLGHRKEVAHGRRSVAVRRVGSEIEVAVVNVGGERRHAHARSPPFFGGHAPRDGRHHDSDEQRHQSKKGQKHHRSLNSTDTSTITSTGAP